MIILGKRVAALGMGEAGPPEVETVQGLVGPRLPDGPRALPVSLCRAASRPACVLLP